jgi:hypothetical protein
LRIRIDCKGFEKRKVVATVTVDGAEEYREELALGSGMQFHDLMVRIPRGAEGLATFDVGVTALPGEAVPENNRRRETLRILNERIRVLYIEGAPRWEYRYLRTILQRDPRVEVTFIATTAKPELIYSSREYIGAFPASDREAFKYDIVILGDVKSSFFRDEELRRLEHMIRDRGSSLLMLAGRRFAPASYEETPVRDLLPVLFDNSPWDEVAENTHLVPTTEGLRGTVMKLEPSERKTRTVWARVKPLDGVPPVTGVKAGAVVLAQLSDFGPRVSRYPLAVWHRYGAGKVMFIGTDRIWRLRLKTGNRYHWRFWSQAIQFLGLSRLLGENRRVRIETDRRSISEGENVGIYAHVLDDEFMPATVPGFPVAVHREDDAGSQPICSLQLTPVAGTPGLYRGQLRPGADGRYSIRSDEGDRSAANEAHFDVRPANRELANPTARVDQLEALAGVSGGLHLSAGNVAGIRGLIPEPESHTAVRRQHSALWDSWWVLVIFVVLCGTEWFNRRWNYMP